jgi:hypothetical protein
MRHVLTASISGVRPGPIQIETCRILPLLTLFDATTVFHFGFLDYLALSVSMMKMAPFKASQQIGHFRAHSFPTL